MRVPFLLLAICLLAVPAAAQDIFQTDWSEGPVSGDPVAAWGPEFSASENMSWLTTPGQLSLSPTPYYSPGGTVIDACCLLAFGVETGDFNQDGHQDVVVAFQRSAMVRIWFNEGQDPPGWIEQEVDYDVPEVNAVWPADLDGDGDLDLAGTAIDPHNNVYWWRNEDGVGGAWTRFDVDGSFTNAFEIHAQDLNADGRPDLLSAAYDDSTLVWWENTPPATAGDPPGWQRHEIADDFYGGHALRAGDFDQDGDMDYAAVSGMVHEAAVWLNDGNDNEGNDPAGFTKVTLAADFEGGRSVRVVDLDRDGRLDVVGTCWFSDVRWWRNTGPDPAAWPEQVIADGFTGGHHLNVADMDGDGDLDVLGAAFANWDICWWENDGGQPINWVEHPVTRNFRGVVQACAADLNNDGILEVVGSSWVLGSFNYWKTGIYSEGDGSLDSAILDLEAQGEVPADLTLTWDAQVPESSTLAVRIRRSPDAAEMGEWSAPLGAGEPLPLTAGRYLQYRVEMGMEMFASSPILRRIGFEPDVSSVEGGQAPRGGAGLAAWPNPFNPRVELSFTQAQAGRMRLEVYDLAGRCVSVLADEVRPAGEHSFLWDGCDRQGAALPSGVYFARLQTPAGSESRKIALVR